MKAKRNVPTHPGLIFIGVTYDCKNFDAPAWTITAQHSVTGYVLRHSFYADGSIKDAALDTYRNSTFIYGEAFTFEQAEELENQLLVAIAEASV